MQKLTSLLFIAVIAICLSSCAGNTGKGSDQTVPDVLQDNDNKAIAKLTDETITALIDIDLQIMKYLYTEPPFCDYQDSVEVDGITYYRVTDDNYDTWDEWEEYIRSAYCGELADKILMVDTLVNINGVTYDNGGSKGYALSDRYSYEILSSSDDTSTILMSNPAIDPDDDYVKVTTYTFKLTNDGWRIESK